MPRIQSVVATAAATTDDRKRLHANPTFACTRNTTGYTAASSAIPLLLDQNFVHFHDKCLKVVMIFGANLVHYPVKSEGNIGSRRFQK